MIVLGLTGSIGMGKSTAARDFRKLGIAVHDADRAVHQLMAPGGSAYDPLIRVFPDVVTANGIDRKKLGDQVFSDSAALRQLESILHPLVRDNKEKFLRTAALQHHRLVVLDVPLLYETGTARNYDAVCVVTAPKFVQEARVLKRPGMTREKFHNILDRQVSDTLKRQYADFIIHTGLGRLESWRTIRHIVDTVTTWRPRVWLPNRSG